MYDLLDYQIAEMIACARSLLRHHRNFYRDNEEVENRPDFYKNYLNIKYIVDSLMRQRRARRANVKKIWEAYANHVIEQRNKS